MSTILFTAWGYDVSILEFIAALTSFIGVGLGVTAKRITWPWWALSSSLYAIFFYPQAPHCKLSSLQQLFGVGLAGDQKAPLHQRYLLNTACIGQLD
jgi:nicotinamide mononucleotide transporter